ncbi:MAG: transposase [Thaumarchaeota archaeon]|nr:transposase [Nitrososphaerota archaeon]
MASKRSRKDDKKKRQDAHVRAYREERRRQKIKECRDYKTYERKRKGEGKVKRIRIKQLAKLIRDTLPNATDTNVSRIVCVVDMTYRGHSYRRHVEYLDEHSGSVGMYGLKRVPSKSGLHGWAGELAGDMEFVLGLLAGQAGDDARGTLLGDSSGFSIVKYEDWEDAKRGIISRREFNKLHILVAPHGRIATCAITAGRRHDSPVFREMYGRIPQGSGRIILDAAYLCKANCRMIARSGRSPVICPKSNSRAKGLHPMGRMLRWYESDRDGFDRAYHQRSLVETAFSVIKERFGAVARAKTFRMRQLQLALKCVCYNLVA